MQTCNIVEHIKSAYHLENHLEGGWFSEIYTSSFGNEGRAFAGSIYFLLVADEISHFHFLDCDEIWYYHSGCGVRIVVLEESGVKELLLGINPENNESPSIIIPKGTVFAAENINRNGYSFVSCATSPKFIDEGLHFTYRADLESRFPDLSTEILNMAFPKFPE